MTAPSPHPTGQLPAHPPFAQQPARRRTWLTVVTSVVLGVGALIVAVLIVLTRGPEAAFVGFLLAALPVPFLVAVFLWLDRYEPEPWRYLLSALGWGAVMATTLGVLFTAVGSELSDTDASLDGVLWAPVTEELSKGLFIVLAVLLRRREIDGVLDGIVYAGMVGIGFAFTENILYYVAVYSGEGLPGGGQPGGIAAATGLFIVRGVMAPFAHPLFTAALGIGMGLALRSRSWPGRILWPVAGYLGAVALHAAWNGSALLGGGAGFLLTYVAIMMPALALLLGVALWVRRREGRVLTRALTDLAHRGWLHPAEVPWIASLRHRGSARSYARRLRGAFGARAVKEYQLAAAEMGFLHNRVMHGRPPRDAAEQGEELRRRIALWRPHVVLPPPMPVPPPELYDPGRR